MFGSDTGKNEAANHSGATKILDSDKTRNRYGEEEVFLR